jgi:phage tail-like protein
MARRDALTEFNYKIDVSFIITGYFTECSGLGSEHEVVEHKVYVSGGREEVKMMPGRLKWDRIKLKRGITDNMDIWNWRKLVVEGKMDDARRNGSIMIIDPGDVDTVWAQWDFVNGWPAKVTGPELKAGSNAIGIEELIIAHEGITRVK